MIIIYQQGYDYGWMNDVLVRSFAKQINASVGKQTADFAILSVIPIVGKSYKNK